MGDDQNFWNFFFGVLFAVFLVVMSLVLEQKNGMIMTSIPLFDFFLIVLAIFRLVRLFSYDKITQFARDFFMT